MIAAFTGSVFLGWGVAAAGACPGFHGIDTQGSRELWRGAAAAASLGVECDFRRLTLRRCWEGYGRVWYLVAGPGSRAIHAVLRAARGAQLLEGVGVLPLPYVCGQASSPVQGREDSCSGVRGGPTCFANRRAGRLWQAAVIV